MSSFKTTTLERVEFDESILLRTDLPLVIDDWTLAFRLGFRGKVFWYVHQKRDKLYRVFSIKKASGGLRVIHNPNNLMRLMSKQLRRHILLPLCKKLGQHVTAYQIGKSTKDAAAQHVAPCVHCDHLDQPHTCQADLDPTKRMKVIVLGKDECAACRVAEKHVCPRRGVKIHMDLKNFFTSTRRSWIRRYFHDEVGYNHYVSGMLAQLMTVSIKDPKTGKVHHGVPQGSKTSGDICNLVADWLLDRRILKSFPGWTYTRYADDLYFSHPENLDRKLVDEMVRKVSDIVVEAGYRVNRKKLHIQRPGKQQKILGIVLNEKVNMPQAEYRKFRSLLFNCFNHGFEGQVARAKKKSVMQLHGWIAGKLAYFSMVSPQKAEKLRVVYLAARKKYPGAEEQLEGTA